MNGMKFNVRAKSRELSAFVENMANKMPKRAKYHADELRRISDKLIGCITDANFYPINKETTKEQFDFRINSYVEGLKYMDHLDDSIEIAFKNRLITEKQFTGSTKINHYLRLSVLERIEKDGTRYKG